MARTRQIKPGFFLHTELAELDPLCRLLFIGLWTIADREGRLKLNPKKIKAEVLPYELGGTTQVIGWIHQLSSTGFLKLYKSADCDYIEIVNFKKHQHINKDEKASEIPSPEQCEPIDAQDLIEKYQLALNELPKQLGSSTQPLPDKLPLTTLLPYTELPHTELPQRGDPEKNESQKQSLAPSAPQSDNGNGKSSEEMRKELSARFGWNGGVATERCFGDYMIAVNDWLKAIYPASQGNDTKVIAGKLVKTIARNAFGKTEQYHKSWYPPEVFVEFLKLAIGEPKEGGGLLADRRYPPRPAEMIRYVNQVFQNQQDTHEYAHAAIQSLERR